jgi:hypothetical protein
MGSCTVSLRRMSPVAQESLEAEKRGARDVGEEPEALIYVEEAQDMNDLCTGKWGLCLGPSASVKNKTLDDEGKLTSTDMKREHSREMSTDWSILDQNVS